MGKKTLISLGIHSYFVKTQIQKGKYSDESSVVKAGLELLESREKLADFENEISKGLDSKTCNDNDIIDTFEFLDKEDNLKNSIKISTEALIDLKKIWNRLNDKKSDETANKYIKSLLWYSNRIDENLANSIKYWDGLFGIKMFRKPGMRRFNYIIYFQINDSKKIKILRFLSQHLDIKTSQQW